MEDTRDVNVGNIEINDKGNGVSYVYGNEKQQSDSRKFINYLIRLNL